jgi:hypothetical protein
MGPMSFWELGGMGGNADEKVQIVNALAKVLYGGGERVRGVLRRRRNGEVQVRSCKRVYDVPKTLHSIGSLTF